MLAFSEPRDGESACPLRSLIQRSPPLPKRDRDIYCKVGRRPKKIANPVEKLREAKATTLRRVRLARSCAMGAKDVAGEVKDVDELGVKVARGRGAEGIGGARLSLTQIAVAFASMHD